MSSFIRSRSHSSSASISKGELLHIRPFRGVTTPKAALPDDPKTLVRFTGLGWVRMEGDDKVFAFRSLGREWSFPRAAAPFLRTLLDGQVLPLGEVLQLAAKDLSPEDADRVIRDAVRGGLLTFG